MLSNSMILLYLSFLLSSNFLFLQYINLQFSIFPAYNQSQRHQRKSRYFRRENLLFYQSSVRC